ncbi:MAG: hypothetical protein ABF261_09200, partial [Candidatus Arcticimaribacter sp.]
MSKAKQIAWESWNAVAEEMMLPQDIIFPEANGGESGYSEIEIPADFFSPEMFMQQQRLIYTPLGVYPEESCLKPSD